MTVAHTSSHLDHQLLPFSSFVLSFCLNFVGGLPVVFNILLFSFLKYVQFVRLGVHKYILYYISLFWGSIFRVLFLVSAVVKMWRCVSFFFEI